MCSYRPPGANRGEAVVEVREVGRIAITRWVVEPAPHPRSQDRLWLAYTYEVVELVPDERRVMRTSEGPFPMETSYTWETTSDGATRMTLRNRGTPTGFSRWLAPFIAGAMRRANRKDLAALQKRLESPVKG